MQERLILEKIRQVRTPFERPRIFSYTRGISIIWTFGVCAGCYR